MKCDELKSFIVLYDGKFERVYAEKKVDAAIAELKDENRRLKDEIKRLENVRKVHIEGIESMCEGLKLDAKQICKTQRALWLARAERAASWQIHFSLCHNHSIERQFSINGASMPCEGMLTMRTARDWAMIWEKVERKCRAKAEEYK